MFKELYYWMYFYVSKVKTNKTPAFNAYVLICFLNGVNIETFFIFINYNLKLGGEKFNAFYVGGGLAAVLYIINYFLLYKQRKDIFDKYNKLQQRRRIKGQIYFWMYVVLSFIIFYIAVENLVTPTIIKQ